MLIITAVRDFAAGLARGLSLAVTDRSDYDECFTMPEAGWARCLQRVKSAGRKPRQV